ncbi:hypothetical protein [Pseudomonas synxantha]|uniref:hypothetical protein n=1 Tax=Pseudomonas synxantha TaxID=47883 RepID=UPI000AB90BC9|nr:hypothetical protein [Pseudomonas synxantha]
MASWFSEGTVTVTNGNAVVTGVGTKFSNCRSGDMFVGPDNGIYQVINSSSDTSISISPAYRGATSAGAAYGIVPVNGYPKALADAVNLMVQQWGSTLAGLGTVSTENVVPVAKGGTGGTTQAAARTGLGLGTVAPLNTGRAPGNVPTTEMIGFVGSQSTVSWTAEVNPGIDNKVFASADFAGNPQGGTGLYYRQTIQFGTTGNRLMIAWPYGVAGNTGTIKLRSIYNGGFTPEIELYHTGNTTRAQDGTLKAI